MGCPTVYPPPPETPHPCRYPRGYPMRSHISHGMGYPWDPTYPTGWVIHGISHGRDIHGMSHGISSQQKHPTPVGIAWDIPWDPTYHISHGMGYYPWVIPWYIRLNGISREFPMDMSHLYVASICPNQYTTVAHCEAAVFSQAIEYTPMSMGWDTPICLLDRYVYPMGYVASTVYPTG